MNIQNPDVSRLIALHPVVEPKPVLIVSDSVDLKMKATNGPDNRAVILQSSLLDGENPNWTDVQTSQCDHKGEAVFDIAEDGVKKEIL